MGEFTGVRVPPGDPLLDLAARTLRRATSEVDQRPTQPRWKVQITVDDSLGMGPEAYRAEITRGATGGVRIEAADRRGAARGLFHLAQALDQGAQWSSFGRDGQTVSPDLTDRFVDTGAVGVTVDPDAWRAQDDYQHSSGALEGIVLAEEPYIDSAGLAETTREWQAFVDHTVAQGYNGVIVPGFLEYVNFDRVGDSFDVYPADSPYRARHTAMREQVGAMWKYAHDMGMKVVFKTDMLALTGPLEDHLESDLGGIDPNDPELWAVYRAGVEELLSEMPWADGVMIRIGEGGSIYNHPGWDYYSRLAVTDVEGVQTMLRTFTDAAAATDDTIWFRTWSVGVGDVGDMHTNPETYARVLGDLDIDNLVVSTKFTMGDFDSWLPLNPTLFDGPQRRIVEFQARREFEAFSSIPNPVAGTHAAALEAFLADNPRIDGLWTWTQDGGPWRAGPMSLYLREGNWGLYDLDVAATAALGWHTTQDPSAVAGGWMARTWSHDPATVEEVGRILDRSRTDVVLPGLYIGPYAEKQVFALGLEPPPMMWIFKWDIVSGDSAALSAVYLAARDDIDAAIESGRRAADVAQELSDEFAAIDARTFHDPAAHEALAGCARLSGRPHGDPAVLPRGVPALLPVVGHRRLGRARRLGCCAAALPRRCCRA